MPTPASSASTSFHALIRTHHITSRKKVNTLRAAARTQQVQCVLRSGGVPGLMYVRGMREGDVRAWVDTVHGLRYKGYQLMAAPTMVTSEQGEDEVEGEAGSLEEVAEVKDFGRRMDEIGVREWWRAAMGFAKGK